VSVRGYILVETEVGRTQAVGRAMRDLKSSLASVAAVDTVTGPFDVIVQLEAEDLDQLGKCITEELQHVDGVQRTTTCLAVRSGCRGGAAGATIAGMTTTEARSTLPEMISVEEARARILEHFAALEAVATPLLEALGQVLAADVHGGFDIPPLANTSMDGFAVRAADTAGATPAEPRRLRVTGYLAAGSVYEGAVGAGEAVRIMTGAPLPDGADAIVPFEETDEEEQTARWEDAPRAEVRIDVAAQPGANVRPAAEDVRAGELVLPAGTILGPAQIGVLASLGLASVEVVRRPRVAILSTGDELVRPGEPLRPGAIYDANAFSLASMAREMGAEPRVLEIAGDTVEALTARVHEGLAGADLLVTSAGVSRGDFDVVKDVLAREGQVGFWTVRMRPGKPLAFGTFETGEGASARVVPHLGLPGNPVSAMMTFELFGRPAVFTMLGKPQAWERERVRAVVEERVARPDPRRFFARAVVERRDGRYHARLTGPQGSGVLTSMALANGILVVPEDVEVIEAGEECDVMLIGRVLEASPGA
jgi:molybdopterin molybdotransferase